MRQKYETKDHRQVQDFAKEWVERCQNVLIMDTPDMSPIDWLIFRGDKLVAVGEFKSREKMYDTLMISRRKVADGAALAQMLNTKYVLFVGWDEIYWTRDIVGEVGWGGRTDRGDPQDREEVLYIPVTNFREI